MQTLMPIAVFFGAACFLFCMLRDPTHSRYKRGWLDYIALIGRWFCPLTWVIYLFIFPVLCLVEWADAKEREEKDHDSNQ
jgi:hypothetical protein